jgi:hypothetical protein
MADPLALTRALQMLVRILGAIVLVLGLVFWTGNALSAMPLHLLLALLLVLCVWALAGLTWVRARAVGLAVGAIVLGLVVIWFGYQQTTLLPGPNHWLVQVAHLLLGVALIGTGEMLGAAMRKAATAASSSPT